MFMYYFKHLCVLTQSRALQFKISFNNSQGTGEETEVQVTLTHPQETQEVELESRQSSSKDHTHLYFLDKLQSLPQRLCRFPYSFLGKTIQLLLVTSIFSREGKLRILKDAKILDTAEKNTVSDGNGVSKFHMTF